MVSIFLLTYNNCIMEWKKYSYHLKVWPKSSQQRDLHQGGLSSVRDNLIFISARGKVMIKFLFLLSNRLTLLEDDT